MSTTAEPAITFVHPWQADIEADTNGSTTNHSIALQDTASHKKNYASDYYYGLPAPNDALETPRLNQQHELFKLTAHGALYISPLHTASIHQILDTGTGTGVWAVEMAEQYPSAQVIGVDLTPVNATDVPANVSFQVMNIEEDWNFGSEKRFDFIHGRMIVPAVTDWSAYLKRAYDSLNPGGWLELQDLSFPIGCSDGTAGPESGIMQWGKYMVDANHALGRVYGEQFQDFERLFEGAGFVNYKQQMFAWPLNTWPKDQHEKRKGALSYKNTMDGMESFTNVSFKRALGWDQERIDDLVKRAKADLGDTNKHTYIPIKFMYAQKAE